MGKGHDTILAIFVGRNDKGEKKKKGNTTIPIPKEHCKSKVPEECVSVDCLGVEVKKQVLRA